MKPEIHPLEVDTPAHVLAALDELLGGARGALVGPRGLLESAAERALDAGDGRLVLWAELDRRPVGIIDALLHHPGPHGLTFGQIAVARPLRFRGVGRALVQSATRDAQARVGPLEALYASVRPRAHEARSFWTSLGFVPSPHYPDLFTSHTELP